MAQVARHDVVDLHSLFSQAKEVELRLKDCPDQKRSWAFVRARELEYANPEGWKITAASAELIGSYVLHVDGNYPAGKLEKLCFEVSFVVLLKDNFNIETPVSLTLTLPDGSTQVNGYDLTACPRNTPISIKAGEFFNGFESGDIKFALDGSESATWKQGLVIYGVCIGTLVLK